MVKAVLSRQIQKGIAEFVLDKARLGEGISQFTVFNSDRIPVCERLYFKFPENRTHVVLKVDKPEYSNREKINIHIASAGQNGLPIGSNLSMAVYQLDSLQELEEMNIENYLFLSSDLSGKIESPGYYFTNEGKETEEAMDNLMLTKGWRRFRWEDIRQNRKPAFEFVPEYVGHIVKAKVTDSATRVPVRGVSAYLSTPGTRSQFRTAISDSTGILHFDMKDFYSDGELILQPRDQREGILSMEVLDPFSHHFSDPVISDFSREKISPNVLMNHQVAVKVQNQYVRKRLNHFQVPEIDTVPFYGKPDFSYQLDDYVRFTTMEEVLREYVAPIALTIRNGKYAVKVFDANREHVAFESDPLVLLNGVPVFDFSRIISYDPLNIRKLDIITRTYFYGNMAFDGIMNFVGYNAQIQGFELDPHSTVLDYDGLQERREFYSPVYETQQEVENRLPDFRTVLCWAPDIKTATKGEIDLSFYSSDLSGRYAVVLQGISPDGQPVSSVAELVVKEKLRK
jgi:hypothetical protein